MGHDAIFSNPSYLLQDIFALSAQEIVELAKEVIHTNPLSCDWGRCHAELNSWKAYQEHLHQHCLQQELSSSQQDVQECLYYRCAGRYHASIADLQLHIDLSHMSRIPLLCLIRDCPATFGRAGQSLEDHIREHHQKGLLTEPSSQLAIRPLRRPYPYPPSALRVLPAHPIPAYEFQCTDVRPATRRQGVTASQISRRRWRRMTSKTQFPATPEEEEAAIPFPDLQLLDLPKSYEFTDYVMLWRPPAVLLQQARPQPIFVPPVLEKSPAMSIGYDAFAARFEELEKAGLIDGIGQWPAGNDTDRLVEAIL